MSDNKLLLCKCITLLYRESLLVEKSDNSADLVRTVLESIKMPELSIGISHEREALIALRDTAIYLCGNISDTEYDKEELLQRLRINCLEDDKLYEAFSQGIEKDMDEGSLKRTILNIRKYINDTFREAEIVKIIKAANMKLSFEREKIKNVRSFVNELCVALEPYQIESSRKDPAIISSVDIGDVGGLNELFDEVKTVADHTGLILTGWQDVNDMLQGGFRRGEQWVLPALQHKYKTGFTLSLFKHFAIYNKPVMINPAKKPVIVRISFEDSLVTNLQFLYQNLIFNETGIMPDIKDINSKDMAMYVKEKMSVNGYHIKMMRVNPSEWTYKDLQNYILELEASGYEVHACIVDYLPMLPTTGCEDGPMGFAMQDMYRRTRNFFSARKILMITPHQLSTEAKQLIRDGHLDFVKKMPEGGYYRGCKSIDQEVDGELFMHIEKCQKRAYLTIQRGKHRGVDVLPDDKKYIALPFPLVGPIPDDLGKMRIGSTKVGMLPNNHQGEVPFYEFKP